MSNHTDGIQLAYDVNNENGSVTHNVVEPTHPVSTYPDRWVGFVDHYDDHDSFFVIMLCDTAGAAHDMMVETFGDDWFDDGGVVVKWSRFVTYDLAFIQGMHRAYYTGNEGERRTWKHGDIIHTIADLLEACK